MNRKILLTVLALAVVLLATPYIGMVQAGKGQEKLDFLLHMEGTNVPPPEKVWLTDGGTRHVQGLPWEIRGDFYIEIGESGAVEAIPKECLSYFGLMDLMANTKQGWYVITVRETITIYTDGSKTEERGTIEILTQGENPGGNGLMVNGHGTGELEGIKITGRTATEMIPNPSPPPPTLLSIDRIGTVMDWPT